MGKLRKEALFRRGSIGYEPWRRVLPRRIGGYESHRLCEVLWVAAMVNVAVLWLGDTL